MTTALAALSAAVTRLFPLVWVPYALLCILLGVTVWQERAPRAERPTFLAVPLMWAALVVNASIAVVLVTRSGELFVLLALPGLPIAAALAGYSWVRPWIWQRLIVWLSVLIGGSMGVLYIWLVATLPKHPDSLISALAIGAAVGILYLLRVAASRC